MEALPLVAPRISHSVGLVTRIAELTPLLVTALIESVTARAVETVSP